MTGRGSSRCRRTSSDNRSLDKDESAGRIAVFVFELVADALS